MISDRVKNQEVQDYIKNNIDNDNLRKELIDQYQAIMRDDIRKTEDLQKKMAFIFSENGFQCKNEPKVEYYSKSKKK